MNVFVQAHLSAISIIFIILLRTARNFSVQVPISKFGRFAGPRGREVFCAGYIQIMRPSNSLLFKTINASVSVWTVLRIPFSLFRFYEEWTVQNRTFWRRGLVKGFLKSCVWRHWQSDIVWLTCLALPEVFRFSLVLQRRMCSIKRTALKKRPGWKPVRHCSGDLENKSFRYCSLDSSERNSAPLPPSWRKGWPNFYRVDSCFTS